MHKEGKMDRGANIQRAIDYIEDHLDGSIDYAEVAKCAYSSNYHFQRVFGILFGMTLGEYIRRRRLSRAVYDLLAGEKVLDVALKYGYESSESFSRAFCKFHGCLPSQVKRGHPAKSFQRLSLNFEYGRGFTMNCTIEERQEKVLVGYKNAFTACPMGKSGPSRKMRFTRRRAADNGYCSGRLAIMSPNMPFLPISATTAMTTISPMNWTNGRGKHCSIPPLREWI